MHLVAFIVVIIALASGFGFVGEVMSGYWAYFLGITVAYFSAWKLAKIYLSHKSSILVATAIYIAGVGGVFALVLLVNGRTFSAWMVAALGLGIAAGIAAADKGSNEKQST